MKRARVFCTAVTFLIFTGAFSQQANRNDICQSIPGLTSQQQQKIDKLGVTHQKKMDALRLQFRSESNAQNAANLKSQMNSELQSHNQNISALLTPEQASWYDQNCNASGTRNYYARAGYGQAYGRRQGLGPASGCRRGTGYGRGAAYGPGAGYGAGKGRRRIVN